MGHLNELPINLDKLLDDSTTDSCSLKKRTFLQNMTSTANTFFIAGGINITTSIWTDEEAISREMISETIRKFFKDAQPKLSNTHRYAKNSSKPTMQFADFSPVVGEGFPRKPSTFYNGGRDDFFFILPLGHSAPSNSTLGRRGGWNKRPLRPKYIGTCRSNCLQEVSNSLAGVIDTGEAYVGTENVRRNVNEIWNGGEEESANLQIVQIPEGVRYNVLDEAMIAQYVDFMNNSVFSSYWTFLQSAIKENDLVTRENPATSDNQG